MTKQKLFLEASIRGGSISRIDQFRREVLDKLNRLYNSDLGFYIDLLTRVNKVGYYNTIAREIIRFAGARNRYGISTKSVVKNLKRFGKFGLKFYAKANYARLGLYVLFVFIPRYVEPYRLPYIEWLSFYTLTKSIMGTMVYYYIPAIHVETMVSEIRRELEELVKNKTSSHKTWYGSDEIIMVLFEDVDRFQPKFSTDTTIRPDTAHFKWLLNGYTLEDLELIFEKVDEEVGKTIDITKQIARPDKYKPYDIIDLIIIKEYEQDAFKQLISIMEKYSLPSKILKKHLEKHVNNQSLIKGIYLSSKYFIEILGEPVIILLSFNNKEYFNKVINFFKQLAPTIGMYYATNYVYEKYGNLTIEEADKPVLNNDKYTLLIGLYKTINHEDTIYRFIERKLVEEGYLEHHPFIINYIGSKSLKRSIPYTNYDQEKRNWTIETEISYTYFIRRLVRDNIVSIAEKPPGK